MDEIVLTHQQILMMRKWKRRHYRQLWKLYDMKYPEKVHKEMCERHQFAGYPAELVKHYHVMRQRRRFYTYRSDRYLARMGKTIANRWNIT